MRLRRHCAIAFCCAFVCVARAQDDSSQPDLRVPKPGNASTVRSKHTPQTLTTDDGLSVIAAALDSRGRHSSESDCSHLAHAIYERAGFPYTYASSSDLYAGVDEFERVARPQTGDLIVWRGHVGIVIKPSRHVFFSLLSSGPGTDDWTASYWRARGHARFYRYIKPPGLPDVKPSRQNRRIVNVSR